MPLNPNTIDWRPTGLERCLPSNTVFTDSPNLSCFSQVQALASRLLPQVCFSLLVAWKASYQAQADDCKHCRLPMISTYTFLATSFHLILLPPSDTLPSPPFLFHLLPTILGFLLPLTNYRPVGTRLSYIAPSSENRVGCAILCALTWMLLSFLFQHSDLTSNFFSDDGAGLQVCWQEYNMLNLLIHGKVCVH